MSIELKPRTRRSTSEAKDPTPLRHFALSLIRRALDDLQDGDAQAHNWLMGGVGKIPLEEACTMAQVPVRAVKRIAGEIREPVETERALDVDKLDDLTLLKEDDYEWVSVDEAAKRFSYTRATLAGIASRGDGVTTVLAPRSEETGRRTRYFRLDDRTLDRITRDA